MGVDSVGVVSGGWTGSGGVEVMSALAVSV